MGKETCAAPREAVLAQYGRPLPLQLPQSLLLEVPSSDRQRGSSANSLANDDCKGQNRARLSQVGINHDEQEHKDGCSYARTRH